MLQGKPFLGKMTAYLPVVLTLLVLSVFYPVTRYEFINFDDPSFVVANPYIQSGVTVQGIRWAFSSGYEANWIPLSWISHMVDIQLFGHNPAGHHFVNLLFHLGSTLLLYHFLRTTTNAPWRSGAVALLFALHPLHVESVAWVAERKDVLSCFFWMLTLCAYARYSNSRRIGTYLTVLCLFTLGLLAKPMLVPLPLVLLLLDWWPLNRYAGSDGDVPTTTILLRLGMEKIPLFLLSAGSSAVTYLVQHEAGSVTQTYLLPARIARALMAYVSYLGKMFWPDNLSIIYPFSKLPPTPSQVALSGGLLLVITGLAIWGRKRHPYLVTGWFWYMVSLLPVIGLVQIGHHSIADRYTYIPLIGIFMALAWWLPDYLRPWRYSPVALGAIFMTILGLMIILTTGYLHQWQNSITLFRHSLQVTENNWVAHNNLGLALLDQGETDEAISQFRHAVKAKPTFAPAFLNLGFAYRTKGELRPAFDAFRSALQFEPGNEKAHLGLGLLSLEMGEKELALAHYAALKAAGSAYAPPLMQEIMAVSGGQ